MKKIYCISCNTDKHMEVSETIDGYIYCSCTKCGMPYKIEEAQEVEINGQEFIYLPLLNAAYRRDTITKKYFQKFSYGRDGNLKKRAVTVGQLCPDYDYVDKKVN